MNREEALDFLVKEVSFWSGGGFGGCGWWFEDSVFCHPEHAAITIDDWNRAKIKPRTKIQILSEEHSGYVQDLAFNAGFEWETGEKTAQHLNKNFLFFYDTNTFTFSNLKTFENSNKEEIFIEMPKQSTPNINAKVLAEKVGSKYDQGKPRYDLIPVHAEAEFVDVLTFGATKYGAENWRKVEDAKTRYQAALGRHIAAYRMGETHDIESGKHHLAHAMCCLAFIIELDLEDNQ